MLRVSKAVNHKKRHKDDTRRPGELLEIIEVNGKGIGEVLAVLRGDAIG